MSAIAVLEQIIEIGSSVIVAVLPLAALFLLFQILFLQLPLGEVKRILIGTLVASAGLFLFLLGVSIALLPYGRAIGEALGTLPQKWILPAFGALLGFVTIWGEPAVRILADQVEHEKIFGMSIEPEKEIMFTVVRTDLVDTVLEEIVRAADLNDTGRGIAFVVPVERVVGVARFMKAMSGNP
ncbi:MAG: DUF1538 family protein [Burkholderiales bacterium]|nr:DUF1538 family protein [Burkholderiales bacterium]